MEDEKREKHLVEMFNRKVEQKKINENQWLVANKRIRKLTELFVAI